MHSARYTRDEASATLKIIRCDWYKTVVGRNSSVGIATRYELHGPGIETRWEARFSAPVHTSPGAHPSSCTMGTGSLPGVKRPGRGVDHPPSSRTEVKGRVGLYIFSFSGPSWPVLGWPLPLPLIQNYLRSSLKINIRVSKHVGVSVL